MSGEGPVDNFVNALRFSVSNVASLAIWGISYFAAMFVSIFILVFSILAFSDYVPIMIMLFIIGFLPVIAIAVLLMGFVSRCLRTVIDGGSVMPTGLESPGDLLKDGVVTFIILVEAVVSEFACFVPGFLLIFLARPGDSALLLAGMALMLLAIPVILAIFFLNVIQWAIYADTGSLMMGLNPLEPVSMVLSNPGGAVVAAVSVIAACLLFGIVMFVCELTIVGVLLIPFLIIAMYGCLVYLVAVFYRQSRGDDGLGNLHDVVTAGFSLS